MGDRNHQLKLVSTIAHLLRIGLSREHQSPYFIFAYSEIFVKSFGKQYDILLYQYSRPN